MYQRMLVPLDGSEVAEVAVTYAKELVARLDLEEVIILHVSNPSMEGFLPMRLAYVEQTAETIRREARKIRSNLTAPADTRLAKVRGELVVGYPADEILRYADEHKIDLILIARHGRSGIRRWTLGSVSAKIMSASKLPVLLVPACLPGETPYDEWPTKTVIVPLDGSELAETALPHAEAVAKQLDTEPLNMTLLRIFEPPTTPTYYGPDLAEVPLNWGQYVQEETERGEKAAKEYLATVENRLKEKRLNIRSEVIIGKASDIIVDYANKNPHSIIVMTTHGRSGLSRWVYGSVAQNVIRAVCCPVLVIKPD
ncbi:MAG: universal stress protein [Chloroflexi bacterium]|nr:universal stress protein [Chloroflexota bacterium]